MKLSKTLAITLIVGGLSISSQAGATNMDNLISRLVSTAVSQTVEDLNNDLKQSVASAVSNLGNENIKTKVEIKDLKQANEKSKENAK